MPSKSENRYLLFNILIVLRGFAFRFSVFFSWQNDEKAFRVQILKIGQKSNVRKTRRQPMTTMATQTNCAHSIVAAAVVVVDKKKKSSVKFMPRLYHCQSNPIYANKCLESMMHTYVLPATIDSCIYYTCMLMLTKALVHTIDGGKEKKK